MNTDQSCQLSRLSQALDHLRSAIELLDQTLAPGHIAAHVDLAASRLEELTLATAKPAGALETHHNGFDAVLTSSSERVPGGTGGLRPATVSAARPAIGSKSPE